MKRIALSLSVAALAACSGGHDAVRKDAAPASATGAAYLASVEQWRSERAERLRNPDGWLSFTGSGQVSEGDSSVGSAPGNAIVVPKGPAKWGTLRLSGHVLRFDAEPGSGVTIDGKPFESAALLTQLDKGGPTAIHAGQQRFYVVKTGDVYGWRFRDPESPALAAFNGVPHFPVDPSWRIEAKWTAYAQPLKTELVTSNGTTEAAEIPGEASFERDGRRFTLKPIIEDGETDLFFIIADRTSGKETYGGARFLYAAAPQDGKVVLDFNRAQNPPCALNGHVVCPTAPAGNRLPVRVEAGEKTYPLVH